MLSIHMVTNGADKQKISLLQVVLAEQSLSHQQPKHVDITETVGTPAIFQMQGSSNLCGLCALNNAISEVTLLPSDVDRIADQLWVGAALEDNMGITSPLIPTRCQDGKTSFLQTDLTDRYAY